MAINRNDWINEVKQDAYGVTGNPAQLSTASGSAPSYSARAWVNFNGSGVVSIRASGNVSSITDNGVGTYTINFTTAMQDANYSVTTGVIHDSSTTYGDSVNIGTMTAGTIQVTTWIEGSGAALDDKSIICVNINR